VHKVKTQRFEELLVKNMLIIYVYMIIITTYISTFQPGIVFYSGDISQTVEHG